MDWAQVILWVSIVLVGTSLLGSLWLLIQAFLDQRALRVTGKNGPLKTLARIALIQEALRFTKLLALLVLFVLANALDPGEYLALRRGMILLVVVLISAGSFHGNLGRRALTQALIEANAR